MDIIVSPKQVIYWTNFVTWRNRRDADVRNDSIFGQNDVEMSTSWNLITIRAGSFTLGKEL